MLKCRSNTESGFLLRERERKDISSSNYLPTTGDDIFECCSLMCKHIVFIATAVVIVSFTLPNRFWGFNVRGNGESCLVNT